MTMTQRLRAALTKSGKSPSQISEATGIPQVALRRFVAKGGGLRAESFDRLAAFVGLQAKPRDTQDTTPGR